jgi:hypothetical protein
MLDGFPDVPFLTLAAADRDLSDVEYAELLDYSNLDG